MPEAYTGAQRGTRSQASGSAHRNARSAIRARSCWAIAPKVPSARWRSASAGSARPTAAGPASSPVARAPRGSRRGRRSARGRRVPGAPRPARRAARRRLRPPGPPRARACSPATITSGTKKPFQLGPLLRQQAEALEMLRDAGTVTEARPEGRAERQAADGEPRRRLGPERLAVRQGDRCQPHLRRRRREEAARCSARRPAARGGPCRIPRRRRPGCPWRPSSQREQRAPARDRRRLGRGRAARARARWSAPRRRRRAVRPELGGHRCGQLVRERRVARHPACPAPPARECPGGCAAAPK